ncbi:uncharacterized protein B0I36DRAFT_44447 [Microdochium trichocladiopsis]|uniref:Uncharacterized protein n=1 Tax=Microdochium trichocladiopsis TaxID=1682393 RepID=A0A9P9BJ23_9PEZI|nr:uncharacterized protein B0I36DRAFT_44447 [Microdochium trichocladiopsis]KAH7016283.1 hypothetical protein B0I36DRAFT_44447 [Microdochium trichocladiopsis]
MTNLTAQVCDDAAYRRRMPYRVPCSVGKQHGPGAPPRLAEPRPFMHDGRLYCGTSSDAGVVSLQHEHGHPEVCGSDKAPLALIGLTLAGVCLFRFVPVCGAHRL